MVSVEDPVVKGYVSCVRHAWLVHLMLIHDGVDADDTGPIVSSHDLRHINTCLEVIFSDNVFQFWMKNILQTPAYQVSVTCDVHSWQFGNLLIKF